MLPASTRNATSPAAIAPQCRSRRGRRRDRWIDLVVGGPGGPGEHGGLARRGLGQVVLELLQEADVRVHASTSEVSCIPRSCSIRATFRSPRLTRWRALASLQPSRSATSG